MPIIFFYKVWHVISGLLRKCYTRRDVGRDNCLETHIAYLGQTAENSLSACSITLAQGSDLYQHVH